MRILRPILLCSLAANALAVTTAGVLVQRRGGLDFLAQKFGLTHTAGQPANDRGEFIRAAQRDVPVLRDEIVFVGDSLTYEVRWAEHLVGLPARNFGVPSDTSADALRRIGDVAARRPGVVVITVGTNDLLRSMNPAGVAANVRSMVAELRSARPDVQIVLHSVPPSGVVRMRHFVPEANAALEAVAAEQGLVWVDTYASLVGDNGDIRPEYTKDGIHLTAAGNAVWLDALSPVVAQLSDPVFPPEDADVRLTGDLAAAEPSGPDALGG